MAGAGSEPSGSPAWVASAARLLERPGIVGKLAGAMVSLAVSFGMMGVFTRSETVCLVAIMCTTLVFLVFLAAIIFVAIKMPHLAGMEGKELQQWYEQQASKEQPILTPTTRTIPLKRQPRSQKSKASSTSEANE